MSAEQFGVLTVTVMVMVSLLVLQRHLSWRKALMPDTKAPLPSNEKKYILQIRVEDDGMDLWDLYVLGWDEGVVFTNQVSEAHKFPNPDSAASVGRELERVGYITSFEVCILLNRKGST